MVKLEVCIDRFESARAALVGGAQRVEVCGALAVGGITPSEGFVEQCLELGGIEVMVMIRPHAGGFGYGSDEIETMLRDIRRVRQLGAHGVVFGALHNDGRVDSELCRRLLDAARPMAVTFHRAFDLARDPLEALAALLDLGVDRVLTSGQKPSALEGAGLIRQLVDRAGQRLSIMAGAGINSLNVASVVGAAGVREVHASASDLDARQVSHAWGFVQPARVTTVENVRALIDALRSLDAV